MDIGCRTACPRSQFVISSHWISAPWGDQKCLTLAPACFPPTLHVLLTFIIVLVNLFWSRQADVGADSLTLLHRVFVSEDKLSCRAPDPFAPPC